MRLSLITVLFVILLSQVTYANPLCGPKPDIADANLVIQIENATTELVRLNVKGQKLFDKAADDFAKLQRISLAIPPVTLASAYFFYVCKALLGEERQISPQLIDKFEILSKALNTPKSAEEFIANAKATQDLEKTVEASDENTEVEKSGVEKSGDAEIEGLNQRGFTNFEQSPEQKATDGGQFQINSQPKAKPIKTKPTKAEDARVTKRVAQRRSKATHNCKNFGEIGECSHLEEAITNLKEANLKYNHPKNMYLGKKTLISLIIETTGEDQTPQFQDYSGEVKTSKSKISRFMEATLTGQDFDIEPSGPQRKTLTNLVPAKWTWYVTPQADGENKRLNLDLSAILREGSRNLPPVTIKTFSTEINVNVRWWDRMLTRVQAFDPIYQLGAAIGGIATAILLIWRIWAILRRFGRKPKLSE